MIKASTKEAYRLFHEGSLALAQVEHHGMRIDTAFLDHALIKTEQIAERKETELRQDEVYKIWEKEYGPKTKIGSDQQLAHVIYDIMGYPCVSFTQEGKPSMDEAALENIDLPFVQKWIRAKKIRRVRNTFLMGFKNEMVDGYLHPFFNLHTTISQRSCIAKGTLIETVRNTSAYPHGVPIEKVKEGDLVYCFDENCKLVVKKVLWAGKTGHRKTVRVYWQAGRHRKGHIDLTPEHKVRMATGRYVQVQNIGERTFKKEGQHHVRKARVLAVKRGEGEGRDMLWVTGEKEPLHDHRVIYKSLVGELKCDDVIHHKDRDHYNNELSNLQKTNRSDHASMHAPESLTNKGRRKGTRIRMERHRNGIPRWRSGLEHYRWIHLSKYKLLRLLAENKGMITHLKYTFSALKRKAELLQINLKSVAVRFNNKGQYLWKKRVEGTFAGSRTEATKKLGINPNKLRKLLESYKLVIPTCWVREGRTKSFLINNHAITRVEDLGEWTDVYDIEVEDCHNFIANEICVHNSSDSINFQNNPTRDPWLARWVRSCIIPRGPEYDLGEGDFTGAEVRVAACYNKDPVLIKYIKDSTTDMHRDMAAQIYMIPEEEVSKDPRYCAKNQFVFAQFYGSYYIQCAPPLWQSLHRKDLRTKSGRSIKKILAKHGITELGDCDPRERPRPGTFEHHLKKVEDDFWGRRFKVYAEWKKKAWKEYCRDGGCMMYTGFWVGGVYSRNQVLNIRIQGSSFHCLLWVLIELQKWLTKYRMKTRIIGQIHDSINLDIYKREFADVMNKIKELVSEDLPRTWKWLIVPMDAETECCVRGGSWFEKLRVEYKDGQWMMQEDGKWIPLEL